MGPLAYRWYRFRLKAHKALRFLPHPNQKEALSHEWISDFHQDNAETTPKTGETIDRLCIWSVEYFTPSTINSLLMSLRKLGLDQDRVFNDRSADLWLRNSRKSSTSGGFTNLGTIRRRGDKRIFSSGAVGEIPEGIDYINVRIHGIAPSLTACIFRFEISKDKRGDIFARLAKFRFPKFVSFGSAYSVWGPTEIKRQEIDNARLELRMQVHSWINRYFKGFFAEFEVSKRPQIECIFYEKGTLSLDDDKVWDLSGIARGDNDWKFDGKTEVIFSNPSRGSIYRTMHGILSFTEKSLEEQELASYGGGAVGFAHKLEYEIHPFIYSWGLLSLLECMRERISQLRDNELGLGKKAGSKAIDFLRKLTQENAEIEMVCYDLSKHKYRSRKTLRPKLTGGKYASMSARDNLLSWVWNSVGDRAERLLEIDKSVRALAQQQGNLIIADQNLWLQKLVGFITVLAAVLAAISAYSPVKDIWKDLKPRLEAHSNPKSSSSAIQR